MFHLLGDCIFSVYAIWRGFNGWVVMECKGFECFLGVAIRKFNSLISREDFLAIDEINLSDGVAVLLFESSKCTVDKFGRVEWMGLL